MSTKRTRSTSYTCTHRSSSATPKVTFGSEPAHHLHLSFRGIVREITSARPSLGYSGRGFTESRLAFMFQMDATTKGGRCMVWSRDDAVFQSGRFGRLKERPGNSDDLVRSSSPKCVVERRVIASRRLRFGLLLVSTLAEPVYARKASLLSVRFVIREG